MIIKLADMRPAGLCVGRTRVWFAANGLDWRDFTRNGIEAEKLLAVGTKTEDAMRLIEAARARNGER